MTRLTILLLTAALAGCAQSPTSDSGWTTLIDGARGIENWNRVGDANWRAEDGAIVADGGKAGFLVSKSAYRNFQIRAEFWAAHNANSGIYMRCSDPAALTDKNCHEANIFDERPDPKFGTGGIVHIAPVTASHKTGGKWNVYEITVTGTQAVVVLNGVETARTDKLTFTEGPFALQYGTLPPKGLPGGAIKWRKVQIRPL